MTKPHEPECPRHHGLMLACSCELHKRNKKPRIPVHCGLIMAPRYAMQSTVSGTPDLGSVVTWSPGGPGRLVPCWSCLVCGRQVGR